jgi:PKD domain
VILSRSPFPPRAAARRFLSVFGVLAVAGAVAAAPAGAIVTTVVTGNGPVTAGVQPRNAEYGFDGGALTSSSFNNPLGNAVVHSNGTYLIYWDPTDHYHGEWQQLIDGFMANVSTQSGALDNVFAVDGQYTDKSNQHAAYESEFRGAFADTNPYPETGNCTDPHPMQPSDAITCLTNEQLQQQLTSFISQHGLPTGMNSIFYLLTPPGVTICIDGGGASGHCSDSAATQVSYEHSFCSYHSDLSPTNATTGDANTILYGVIPWTAGGQGDGHLAPADQTMAPDCQDGGFDPSSSPIEQPEESREISPKEEEEDLKKSPEELAKLYAEIAREGPHVEEPNQALLSRDGTYDNGLADLIVNQIAEEQQNIVTDPLLNGWQDSAHLEATDECRNFFAPVLGGSVTANENTFAGSLYNQTINGGNYYLNMAFNLAALRLPYPGVPCLPGVSLVPAFTAPRRANSGTAISFNGMESDITLDAGTSYSAQGSTQPNYATYTWNFGDGTPTVRGYAPGSASVNSPGAEPCASPWLAPCAASVFHTYQYGGTYEVTLTVTDVGGNTASVTNPITIAGPLPPGQTPSTGTGSGEAGVPGSTPGATGKALPGPIVSATATSRSLTTALRKGLVIRYSVNEQVAGHFEVLLAAKTARRLGIHGSAAQNLPAGTPASVVIAHAILVTTKGGHNTVRIKFSKSVASRLHRLRKVPLTLRLIVHNGATQNPLSTTATSTVVLR